jgi:hypothetical protein
MFERPFGQSYPMKKGEMVVLHGGEYYERESKNRAKPCGFREKLCGKYSIRSFIVFYRSGRGKMLRRMLFPVLLPMYPAANRARDRSGNTASPPQAG